MEIIDEEFAIDLKKTQENKLHTQLKIFWIVTSIIVSLSLVSGFLSGNNNFFLMLQCALSWYFYYKIVIKKSSAVTTWGFLIVIIISIPFVIAFFGLVYSLIKYRDDMFADDSYLPFVFIALYLSFLAFLIWGVVIHAKYKLE